MEVTSQQIDNLELLYAHVMRCMSRLLCIGKWLDCCAITFRAVGFAHASVLACKPISNPQRARVASIFDMPPMYLPHDSCVLIFSMRPALHGIHVIEQITCQFPSHNALALPYSVAPAAGRIALHVCHMSIRPVPSR